jgi:signal peptidase I
LGLGAAEEPDRGGLLRLLAPEQNRLPVAGRVAGTAAAVLVAAAILFAVLFVRPYRVPSVSMEPSLRTGDRFLALKIGGWGTGDIVVFHAPPRAAGACGVGGTFVKRVLRERGSTVFLVGDNRAESCDSRAYGPVPKANVVGRAFFIYWPPSRWGFR